MKTINLKHFTKNIGKVVQENSPTILTALGVVGVAATGYFTAKAAVKTGQMIIIDAESTAGVEPVMTTRQIVEKHWKLYIPAVTTGVMTVGCIIAANRIQVRRMAALAGAYAVISGDFDEYREKAQELLGVKKSAEVNEHTLKKQLNKYPIDSLGPVPGKTEFFEGTSGRYFFSTIEDVKFAINKTNHKLNMGDQPCLNDFYEALGLETTDIGDEMGWKDSALIEADFTPIKKDDNTYVTGIKFKRGPVPKYWKSRD